MTAPGFPNHQVRHGGPTTRRRSCGHLDESGSEHVGEDDVECGASTSASGVVLSHDRRRDIVAAALCSRGLHRRRGDVDRHTQGTVTLAAIARTPVPQRHVEHARRLPDSELVEQQAHRQLGGWVGLPSRTRHPGRSRSPTPSLDRTIHSARPERTRSSVTHVGVANPASCRSLTRRRRSSAMSTKAGATAAAAAIESSASPTSVQSSTWPTASPVRSSTARDAELEQADPQRARRRRRARRSTNAQVDATEILAESDSPVHVARGGEAISPARARPALIVTGAPTANAPAGTTVTLSTTAFAPTTAPARTTLVEHDRSIADERSILDSAALEMDDVADHALVPDSRRKQRRRVQNMPSWMLDPRRCGSHRRRRGTRRTATSTIVVRSTPIR